MEDSSSKKDLLNININISATPSFSFDNFSKNILTATTASNTHNFSIYVDTALAYSSLSNLLNQYLQNRRFTFSAGIFKQHIIINNCHLYGDENGHINIEVIFSGSHNGTLHFTGSPIYNEVLESIEIKDIKYDIKTKDWLLKTAKWLLTNRIQKEIEKHSSFSLANYYTTTIATLNTQLNKEWKAGIQSLGRIAELKIVSMIALPEHILLRNLCTGNIALQINVTELLKKPS